MDLHLVPVAPAEDSDPRKDPVEILDGLRCALGAIGEDFVPMRWRRVRVQLSKEECSQG